MRLHISTDTDENEDSALAPRPKEIVLQPLEADFTRYRRHSHGLRVQYWSAAAQCLGAYTAAHGVSQQLG